MTGGRGRVLARVIAEREVLDGAQDRHHHDRAEPSRDPCQAREQPETRWQVRQGAEGVRLHNAAGVAVSRLQPLGERTDVLIPAGSNR